MFFLAALFSLLSVTYAVFDLPSPKEIAEAGKNLYDQYGLAVLLLAATIEGLFMINIYIPGSFVIVLSVYLSDKTPSSLAVIALVTWIGFFISSVINYYLGATGGYKALLLLGKEGTLKKVRKWMEKHGARAIFLSSVHPNLQAFVMVCAGIAHESIARTSIKSAVALTVWVPLWTIFFSQTLKHVEIDDKNSAGYLVALLIGAGLAISVIDSIKKQWLSRID